MDPEFDYGDYDYPELGYYDSQKESSEEVSIDSRLKKNDLDDFQDILFQKNQYYQTLDEYRTEKYVNDLISDLIEKWGISQSFAIKLLKKFDFNKNKVNRCLEDGDEFDMMEIPKSSKDKEFDCPICYSTEPIKDGCSLDCGHLFCKDCFKEFLRNAINEGQIMRGCPQFKCNEIITPHIIEKYLKDTESHAKYKKFILDLVVNNSESLLWCPAPSCGNTINFYKMSKKDDILSNIRCECGHCFCLQCKDVAHRPLTCDKFQKWIALIGGKDDSLNEGWIKRNTKKCPNCKVSIEKNQGCMHMTCRSCKFEFCWLCNGDWKQHGQNTGGYYDCNKYKKSDKNMDEGERAFEKFNFYRDRYEQHWNSLKIAMAKKKTILTNLKFINELVIQKRDDTFIKDSLDLIIEARRAITMTYAIGYFLKFGGVDQEMFELQQSLLWEALDGLDKFTDDLNESQKAVNVLVDESHGEHLFDKKFNKFKENLNSRTSGVTAACNKLLKYIEQDLQKKQFQTEENLKIPKLSKKKSEMDKNFWYCYHCTYANTNDKKKCEMCQFDKKVLKRL